MLPLDKLKTYQDNYTKVQENLKLFSEAIKDYMSRKNKSGARNRG